MRQSCLWGSVAVRDIDESSARVVLFAGDPQGYRGMYPFELVEVLFTVSLLLYLNAGMLLLLNLIELLDQRGIDRLSFLRRFKWWFIVFSFGLTVITTLIALWRVTSNLSANSVMAYNLMFGIACLLVVGVDIMLGITVFREVRKFQQISNQLSGLDVKLFLWRLLRFNLVTTITIAIGIIALVVYTMFRGDTNMWAWLALNSIFRLVEVVLLQQFYVLIRKRVPEDSESELRTRSPRANTLD